MDNLTIYDISKLAGVSITTVSRVLNGNNNVSLDTREKVEAVIKKHGYVPRQSARNFSGNELFAVGLLMDDIRHPYMAELAYAIDREFGKWRLNTIICNLSDVEGGFINQMDNLIEKRVNGVIILGSVFEKSICKIAIERRYSGIPFVTVNANYALPNVREVMQDQYSGTIDAVKYLYEKGVKSIGWIYYNQSSSDQKKYHGFLEGMRKCGLTAKYHQQTKAITLEEGKNATKLLLEKSPEVNAIIYSSDTLAIGGVHWLNEQGITIPDQISIIGFNDSKSAKECYPQLTSIDNKTSECGRLAAQLMLDMLNKQPTENVLLGCGLKIRQST